MIKGVITLRRYYFCVAAICAAAVIGISGCAMNTKAESAQTQADASQPESAEAATVVEAVTGPIESMEETPNEELQPVRIYGSASHMEDGRLSIDNRSGVSAEGGDHPKYLSGIHPDPGCSFWYAPYIRGYPGWGDDLCVHWSGYDDEPSAHDQCCYHFCQYSCGF